MKNSEITQKDYIQETLRFCRILTQQKYAADEDARFKNFISYNLSNIDWDSQDVNYSTKKGVTNVLLGLCQELVLEKYGTPADREIKGKISRALANLSDITNSAKERSRDSRIESKIKRMVACF